MAAKFSEGLGEQVTCPICLEHYSDPRLLPCLHTYCRKCLQDLLAKGKRKVSVICPQCREEAQITSGDVTKLKVNFWVSNLLSLLAIQSTERETNGGKTELTCENCDSKAAAKGRFVNCCMFLCNVCFTAHHRLLALKNHQLTTLDEMKDKGIPMVDKQLFCEKHKGEVKKLFCDTCQELICRDCTIIDHRDHQYNFVEDVADQHKQLFKAEIGKASKTKNKIEAVLKSVKKMKENVEETSKVTEKDIDNFIKRQIRALEAKKASLKETTKKIAAAKMKELAEQEDGLTMHLTGLESTIAFTEKVLTNGGSSDVLSLSKQLTSRLSQLAEKPYPEDLCYDDPWQKKKTRLEYNEKLFVESTSCVDIVDALVDHNKSCVARRVHSRIFDWSSLLKTGEVTLEFVVQIKNSLGEKMKFMADRIQVKVNKYYITESTLPITSLEDDTYSFKYKLASHDFEITSILVQVDGKDISGSPIYIPKPNFGHGFSF